MVNPRDIAGERKKKKKESNTEHTSGTAMAAPWLRRAFVVKEDAVQLRTEPQYCL